MYREDWGDWAYSLLFSCGKSGGVIEQIGESKGKNQ